MTLFRVMLGIVASVGGLLWSLVLCFTEGPGSGAFMLVMSQALAAVLMPALS